MDYNNPWYQRMGEIVTAACTAAISYLWWKKKKNEGKFDRVCDELQKLNLRAEIFNVEIKNVKDDILEIKESIKEVVFNICKTNNKKK